MVDNGIQKRIQKRVLELVKKSGCWNPEKNFGVAVEELALFCIYHKKQFKEWKKK